jgi:phosphoglycerol transferase
MVPLNGVSREMEYSFIIKVIVPSLLAAVSYFVLAVICYFHDTLKLGIKVSGKRKFVSLLPLLLLRKFIFPIIAVLLFSTLVYTMFKFRISQNYFAYSIFLEENYTDTKKVKLKFPEKKRNLIFLYIESLETSSLSKELGEFQMLI